MLPRRSFGPRPSLRFVPLALLAVAVLLQLGVVPVARSAFTPPGLRFSAAADVGAAVTLKRFTATSRRRAVVLKWETTSERNTRLFRVWRSSTDSRQDAVPVTQMFARGTNGRPAAYTHADSAAQPGGVYTYFLDEQRTDGSTKQLARVSVSLPILYSAAGR